MKKYVIAFSLGIAGMVMYFTLSNRESHTTLYNGPYHDPVAPEMRAERDQYLARLHRLMEEGKWAEADLLCDTLLRRFPQSPISFMTAGITSYKLNDSAQMRQRLTKANEILDSLILEHNDSRDMMNNLAVIRSLHGKDAAEDALERYMERGLNTLDTMHLEIYRHWVYDAENPLFQIFDCPNTETCPHK